MILGNNKIRFAVENIQQINFDDYSEQEFSIAKMRFLSTRPNSHGLEISEEVLRNCSSSILGKWVVAYVSPITGDATGHDPREQIVGRIPENQDILFEYDNDNYLTASVDVVISKLYAKDFCEIFENGTTRSVSIEMMVDTENGNPTNDVVNAFNGTAVTVLGSGINPSCPQSEIEMVRFSDETNTYFTAFREKENMAEKKIYKIDKSKNAISTSSWGDIDKIKLRDTIMEAANRNELVKAVYLIVEDGWEEAPSEHLKYPVMELKGDTFVYNRGALSSALAYAKQNDETTVINKIKEIYDDLDIDDEGKEEGAEMSEIDFAAVDINDLWRSVWNAIKDRREYDYYIFGIYEQDGKRFAVLKNETEDSLWRLDISITDDGVLVGENITETKIEFIETDNVVKFAEPDNINDYRKVEMEDIDNECEDIDEEDNEDNDTTPAVMSLEEALAQIATMQKDIEDRDNIIMEKDTIIATQEAELNDLRSYKNSIMQKEQINAVENVLSSVAQFMDKETADLYRQEGLKCDFSEIDAWTNKVKASVVDKVVKGDKKPVDFTRISGIIETTNRPKPLWERVEDFVE